MKSSHPKRQIAKILSRSAIVYIKYNLRQESNFYELFRCIDRNELGDYLLSAQVGIPLNERINGPYKHIERKEDLKEKINRIVNEFGDDHDRIYEYLESEIVWTDLREFTVEINLRTILANKYVKFQGSEVNRIWSQYVNSKLYKRDKTISRLRPLLIISIVALIFSFPRIITGLTPAEVLAKKYYQNSQFEYRTGAICFDGTRSRATGSGACSHHGGVNKWIYKSKYSRTFEDCLKEAKRISWVD